MCLLVVSEGLKLGENWMLTEFEKEEEVENERTSKEGNFCSCT